MGRKLLGLFEAFGDWYSLDDWKFNKIVVPPFRVLVLRTRKNPLGLRSNEEMILNPTNEYEAAMVSRRDPLEDEHVWGEDAHCDEVVAMLNEIHRGWLNGEIQKRDRDNPKAGEWSVARCDMFVYWLLWNGFVPGRGMRIQSADRDVPVCV